MFPLRFPQLYRSVLLIVGGRRPHYCLQMAEHVHWEVLPPTIIIGTGITLLKLYLRVQRRESKLLYSLCVLTTFRVRPHRVQGNQVHSINVQCLEVLNPDFQPILLSSKLYSIATWHLCTYSTKILLTIELAENQDLGPPDIAH